MAETLGSLIDKLTIANIRLWHLEDAKGIKASQMQSAYVQPTLSQL